MLKSPNDILLAFKPRTALTRLLPKLLPKESGNQVFRDGEEVVVRLSKRHPPVKGTVVRSLGPTRYLVTFQGVLRKPHMNQMKHSDGVLLAKCVNYVSCQM